MSFKFYFKITSILYIVTLNQSIRGDPVNENICFELLKRFGQDTANLKIIEYQLDHVQISTQPGNFDTKKAVRLFISYRIGTQTYNKSFLFNVPLISPTTCGACGKKSSQYWIESPEIYHRLREPPIKFKFPFNDYVTLFWVFLNGG